MSNLLKIQDIVTDILEKNADTRDDDDLLYLEICKRICKTEYNKNISLVSFESFMKNRKKLKVPSYASVERARRKVQSERDDLVGTVRELRRNKEQEYIDYALN